MSNRLAGEIQIGLFDLLDQVAILAAANKTVTNENQRRRILNKNQKILNQFAENFFIQLFGAFDCYIDYIDQSAIDEVHDFFLDDDSPQNVLDFFEKEYHTIEDMEEDAYFETEDEEPSINTVYYEFLPKLFQAFRDNEVILMKNISNYGAIKLRMEATLVKIGNNKKQATLE